MVEVKTKFRNKYSDLSCPVCKLNEDTQQHVMECTILQSRRKIMVSDITRYSHLFSEEIEKQSLHLKPLNHSGMKDKTTLKHFRQPMSMLTFRMYDMEFNTFPIISMCQCAIYVG